MTALGLGIPTLFAGDWNGTVNPARDYGGEGVGGARVLDADEVAGTGWTVGGSGGCFPDAWEWTFRWNEAMSRCDAVLACRAAIPLVAGLRVMIEVQDGGHSPVVVSLVPRVSRIDWRTPRSQMPEMFYLPARELQKDEEFDKVANEWKGTAEFAKLVTAQGSELGKAVFGALERLILGWWKADPHQGTTDGV